MDKGTSLLKKCVPSLIICLLLTGCVRPYIIDRIKIVQSVGFDIKGDKIQGSASYTSFTKKEKLFMLTGEALTISGITDPFTSESEYPIANGLLRTIVISESFAKRGIQELVSSIVQDPIISSNAVVMLTEQQASEIVSETLKSPPFYLSHLIKNNLELGNTPLTNSLSLINQYYGEGQDIYLPVLNKDEKGVFHMDGVGVFKGDKLQLLLSNKEGLFIKILKDKRQTVSGTYEFTTEQKDKIYFRMSVGKRKIIIDPQDKAAITLKLNVILRDVPKTIMTRDKHDIQELKKQIEKKLSTEIQSMLEKFQKNGTDPIGFGEINRSKNRNWNGLEFYRTTYPNLKFEVNTEINITQSGVGVSGDQG